MTTAPNGNRNWPIWWPLLAALAVSYVIRVYDLDRMFSALFYDAVDHRWPYERAEPLRSFYYFGRFPSLILAASSLLIALFAKQMQRFNPCSTTEEFRRYGLFLSLLILIGPGLIIEAGLKSLWGRPRPIQCQEFGGEMTYVPVGEWSDQNPINSSFPSGHAAAAFYFIGLGFIPLPQHPRRQAWLFIGGLCFGLAMGLTRIAQGGHFLSDVFWAGVIVYLVGAVLARQLTPGTAATPQLAKANIIAG